eukprot:RCo019140
MPPQAASSAGASGAGPGALLAAPSFALGPPMSTARSRGTLEINTALAVAGASPREGPKVSSPTANPIRGWGSMRQPKTAIRGFDQLGLPLRRSRRASGGALMTSH